jgi:hypothetical protein
VTVSGNDLLPGLTVALGQTEVSSAEWLSASEIRFTAPASEQGAVDLRLTNPDGQSATLAQAYTYQPAPAVTGISPSMGALAGGTVVTVSGNDLLPGLIVVWGVVEVAGIELISATEVKFTSPAAEAGIVDLILTNPDGQSVRLAEAYTYQPAPRLVAVEPNTGVLAGGTRVTVTGFGLLEGLTVAVGGIQATEIEIISATEVKFTSPAAGAGIVDLILTNPDGQSARLAEAYTYQPAPSLVEVKPRAGALAGGTAVTVSGSDFLPGLIVVWGAVEVADIELISATQLKFTSPVGQKGLVDLWVANPDGQTVKLAEAYTYQPAPSLVEVKPRAGALAGGTAVTVSGNDLLPGLTVAIGGIQATEIEITSATEVKFTSPAAEAGLVGLILTNPDGQSATLAQAYTYQPAPSLTSVTPQRGASRGGTVIVLNGTGFFDGAQVTFGQTKAGSIKWVSETELRADTPIGEKGAVDITVTNPDGQVVKLAQAFTN